MDRFLQMQLLDIGFVVRESSWSPPPFGCFGQQQQSAVSCNCFSNPTCTGADPAGGLQ
jgi:hypothetical protein